MHVTKTTRAHYYWWIKYWRFSLEIANRQSLLLANISSYTVLSKFFLYVCLNPTNCYGLLKYPSLCYLHHTPRDYQTCNYHTLATLKIPSSHTLFYQKSYFPKTIVDWYNLLPKVIKFKSSWEFITLLHSWLDHYN